MRRAVRGRARDTPATADEARKSRIDESRTPAKMLGGKALRHPEAAGTGQGDQEAGVQEGSEAVAETGANQLDKGVNFAVD